MLVIKHKTHFDIIFFIYMTIRKCMFDLVDTFRLYMHVNVFALHLSCCDFRSANA